MLAVRGIPALHLTYNSRTALSRCKFVRRSSFSLMQFFSDDFLLPSQLLSTFLCLDLHKSIDCVTVFVEVNESPDEIGCSQNWMPARRLASKSNRNDRPRFLGNEDFFY